MKKPLKMLQVASYFPGWGGLEIFLLNYCVALQKRGHDVAITCRPDSFVDQEAKERGIHRIPMTVRRRSDWKALRPYLKLLSQESFDVLHVHSIQDALIPPLAGFLKGVPSRNMTFYFDHPNKLKGTNGFYYKHVLTDVLAVSEAMRKLHLADGIPPEKFHKIHNCVDALSLQEGVKPKKVAEFRAQWAPDNTPLVGFAGRVIDCKGWRDFVQALRLLPHARGVLLGDGDDKNHAIALLYEYKMLDRVTVGGFIKDMPNAISAIDILVVPSTFSDPCPTIVLQSMALSRPVIGTKMGGIPEMIIEEETGYLVPVSNPWCLAEAIQWLWHDPEKRRKMGENAKKRAEEHFGMEKMVDDIEKLYYAQVERKK
jgi:L-malate glycosyltransferase